MLVYRRELPGHAGGIDRKSNKGVFNKRSVLGKENDSLVNPGTYRYVRLRLLNY